MNNYCVINGSDSFYMNWFFYFKFSCFFFCFMYCICLNCCFLSLILCGGWFFDVVFVGISMELLMVVFFFFFFLWFNINVCINLVSSFFFVDFMFSWVGMLEICWFCVMVWVVWLSMIIV